MENSKGKRIAALVGVVAVIAIITVCCVSMLTAGKEPAAPPEESAPPKTESAETVKPPEETAVMLPDPAPIPIAEPRPQPKPYDYTAPVPESESVDDSFFKDAVFIGDSRTDGFILYSGITDTMAYAYKGVMVSTIFDDKVIATSKGKVSIMDAVRSTPDFKKAYVMLGMNEMGWIEQDYYKECYGRVIDTLREIQPEADIYIESMIPVTQSRSDSDVEFNNTNVKKLNDALIELCAEKQVYYVDVGAGLMDENGCIPENAAYDGIHLSIDYCKKWLDYLKSHTVPEA